MNLLLEADLSKVALGRFLKAVSKMDSAGDISHPFYRFLRQQRQFKKVLVGIAHAAHVSKLRKVPTSISVSSNLESSAMNNLKSVISLQFFVIQKAKCLAVYCDAKAGW